MVVTIVGVLAVIAVVAYRKFTLTAKVSEAQNMISAIRIAQEDYKTERGTYADGTGAGGLPVAPTWCPSTGLVTPPRKYDWNASACVPFWSSLPVHVDGPVQFGYRTVASPGTLPTISWVDFTGAATQMANGPWYVIQAQADLDGDGGPLLTELVGTSFQNTIFSHNEGQ